MRRCENIRRQRKIHPGRFCYDVSRRIDNAHPVDDRFAGAAIFQFAINGIDSIRLFQLGANGSEFVGQDGVVFFKGVADNDPVKHAEPAGKQKRGAEREEQHQLRRDRTGFSPV